MYQNVWGQLKLAVSSSVCPIVCLCLTVQKSICLLWKWCFDVTENFGGREKGGIYPWEVCFIWLPEMLISYKMHVCVAERMK